MPEQILAEHRGFYRWLLRLTPLAMAATIAAFAVAGVVWSSQNRQAARERERVCRVANGDRMVLRSLLELAQKNSRVTLKINPERLKQAQQFYTEALALITPVDCKTLGK